MLDVHILCVGKLKERFYTEAAAEYVKRLGGYCRLTLTELPEERLPKSPSRAQIDAALEKEAAAVRAKLPPGSSLVALCVEGKLCSSEELAKLVSDWSLSTGSCCWSRSTGPSRSTRAPTTTNETPPCQISTNNHCSFPVVCAIILVTQMMGGPSNVL